MKICVCCPPNFASQIGERVRRTDQLIDWRIQNSMNTVNIVNTAQQYRNSAKSNNYIIYVIFFLLSQSLSLFTREHNHE